MPKLLTTAAAAGPSPATQIGGGGAVWVHVFSASTSSCTVAIQQSIDGTNWKTVGTITNPTSAGELWLGPSLPNTRVNITSYSSGSIDAAVDFTGTYEPFSWAQVAAATPSSGTFGLMQYNITNANVAALGASLTGNLLVGTLPANSRVSAAYINITTAETSANALTVAMGTVAATYADWVLASDAKSVALYGNDVSERGATFLDGQLYYLTAQPVYLHFIKTTTNLSTVTALVGQATVEYTTYPS